MRAELFEREAVDRRRHIDARRAWNRLLRMAGGGMQRGTTLLRHLQQDPQLSPALRAHLDAVTGYVASGRFGDVFRTSKGSAIKIVDLRYPVKISPVLTFDGKYLSADHRDILGLESGDRITYECADDIAPEGRLSRESILQKSRQAMAQEVTLVGRLGLAGIGPKLLYPERREDRIFYKQNEIAAYVMEAFSSDLFDYMRKLTPEQTKAAIPTIEAQLSKHVYTMVKKLNLAAFDLKTQNVLVRASDAQGIELKLADVAPDQEQFISLSKYDEPSKSAIVVVLLMLLSNDISRFTRQAGLTKRVFQENIETILKNPSVAMRLQELLKRSPVGDMFERVLRAWGVDKNDPASIEALNAKYDDRDSLMDFVLSTFGVRNMVSPEASLPKLQNLSPSKLLPPPLPQKKRPRTSAQDGE